MRCSLRGTMNGGMARDSTVELQAEFATLAVCAGLYLHTACCREDTVNSLRRLNLLAACDG